MSTPNPYAPPQAEVSDEPFPPSTQRAAPGRRLSAVILDVLFLFCAILPSVIAVGLERSARLHDGEMAATIGGVVSLIGLVVWLIWSLVLLHQGGQTLGKRVLRIRIVRSNGGRASLPRLILLRYLVSIVLLSLPNYGMLCFLCDSALVLGKARQCLHDRTADTIVVSL